MRVLWQWHRITARGNRAIIARAQAIALMQYANTLEDVANGPRVIKTLSQAKRFLVNNELGCIDNVDIIELDGHIQEVPRE